MGDEFTVEDALIILRRRFLYFLIPVLIIAPLGVVTVMLLPPKYTAQGTILVESQQIPTDLVRSTVNSYAQERIQIIRQRVMTRNRMLEVANKFALFPAGRRLSETERVKRMRERLDISLITTDATRASSRDNTIAFTVAYKDTSPDKAQLVANDFLTSFQSEDVRARTTGASNTTEFFEREAANRRKIVAELETNIAEYKTKHANALPEHLNLHLDLLERATRDLNDTQTRIVTMEEEQRFLENQLLSGGGGDDGPAQELNRLKTDLSRLRSVYHDRHPNIQALKGEISALESQLRPSAEIIKMRTDLADAEDALALLQSGADADPVAIAAAEKTAATAREALSDKITQEARRGSNDPQGVQLEGRIAVINNRVRMLTSQSAATRTEIANLQERIALTPEVERGLAALTRDRENNFSEYQDILSKQQDAQLSENLEQNQQAEKFSILEPALRPEKPSSPDRPRLIALALLAALAVGSGVAFAAEFMFATIRGRNHLAHIIDGHPIAVIPYIPSETDRRFFPPLKARKNPSQAPPSPAPSSPTPSSQAA